MRAASSLRNLLPVSLFWKRWRLYRPVSVGHVGLDWRDHVRIDPKFFRPADVNTLRGDAAKARRQLGWEPKVRFKDLAKMMVDTDMKLADREKVLRDHEHKEIGGV